VNPSLALSLPDMSQVLEFFVNAYRTPPFLLPIYLAAGERYGVPWEVLAAINEVESNYGYDLSVSSAGAEGWMQFLPAEWLAFGVDANGAGVRDPYNPADAVFAAARYLASAGGAHDLRGAIYAYNHSASYVESVMLRMRVLAGTPPSLNNGLTAIVAGRYPVEGGEDQAATAVWARTPAEAGAPQPSAAGGAAARPATAAPAPTRSAATATGVAGPAVAGAIVTAPRGAGVLAVQRAEVTRIGRDSSLGDFIELRDAFGDIYTYARLGRVAKRYASRLTWAGGGPTQSPQDLRSGLRQAPLREGTWVAAGTVLGSVPGEGPGPPAHFLFKIRPAGAGPIDPRPILQAWRLLGETEGHPHRDTQPLFGPNAGDALASEILLVSQGQLEQRLLSSRRFHIYGCGRRDIAAGRIDRRVLSTLDFLLASGIEPTVTALQCGHEGASTPAIKAEHSSGDAVAISAFNGISIRGHHAAGSLAELAVRRLLALPAAMRPNQIISQVRLPATAGTLLERGFAAGVDIGFIPLRPASVSAQQNGPPRAGSPQATTSTAAPLRSLARPDPTMTTAQWRKLMTRISRLAPPQVPSTPTSAAVADNASSPAPAPGAPAVSGPLPLTGAPTPAKPDGGARSQSAETPTASPPGFASPRLDLRAPGTTTDLGALSSSSGVLLETVCPACAGSEQENGSVLRGEEGVTLRVVGVQPPITSIEFQRSPAQAETWTTIANEAPTSSHTTFHTNTSATPDGLYDLRVIVSDAGGVRQSVLRDRLIANEAPVLDLKVDPGPNVNGANLGATIKLRAPSHPELPPSPVTITSVGYEVAEAGKGNWRRVASATQYPYKASFDTSSVPDGIYDLRVVPEGYLFEEKEKLKPFASIPLRARLVDNTPPTVSLLTKPESRLHGRVSLSASAEDSGSGVALVVFERAPAGSKAWHRIGESAITPYTHPLNTQTLPNGRYDLRATAIDLVGNRRSSAEVGVEVNNPPSPPAVSASIAGVVAPANHVTILGSVTSSSHHETWAYGFTGAPPAEASGSPLPYTANGQQLVLLRFTDEGGWQIADVLRNPDGSAFEMLPASKVPNAGEVLVSGAMTASGEAWLWLAESGGGQHRGGLFHRRPGGSFELDPSATNALGSLLEGESLQQGGRLRLGQAPGGSAYGMLTAHAHEYGLLQNGKWTLETVPPPPASPSGETMTLQLADVQGPGSGWGAFTLGKPLGRGLILGRLENRQWSFAPTGLDALDLTGALGNQEGEVVPEALKADGSGVWIQAKVRLHRSEIGNVVARYDAATGGVTNSWCTLSVANSCEEPLDLDHPAAVPDAIIQTASGPVALALQSESVRVYANGQWASVAAPGYRQAIPNQPGGGASFTGPNEGWLGGATALGQWTAKEASGVLSSWPLPDRSPLTSVAVSPHSSAAVGESGALAVGLDGTTLRYDASSGWLVQAPPPRAHHINLLGVAFTGPSSAVAVGQFGVILRWNGSAWSEDPQSISLTQSQLNAVAFGPSGEGWAVGANGTILHYDGHAWQFERPPPADAAVNITSVAAAGSEVFAVAGGNLISRSPDGSWHQEPLSLLPSNPPPAPGNLRLVAAVPDGGVVVAGRSLVLVRERPEERFKYAPQPLQGIAVALAPFRQSDGKLRAYVSVAPPASGQGDVAGFPPGDGELVRQTDSGWQDVSRAQYAGSAVPGDGAVKSDPVLAVASSPTGDRAWAVGGYAGTLDAAEQGSNDPLSNRDASWRTASIWRYDGTGSALPPGLTVSTPSLPAKPGTVSFAFFTSPACRVQCAGVPDAQPDVNLIAAAKQIAGYASQPGGPAFAMLGGEARGPLSPERGVETAVDFAHLPTLLAPLGGLPLFAALGRRDNVGGQADETQPWSEAFADSPPPFGSGAGAAGITAVSSGEAGSATPNGLVHRYYAFDSSQNGARLRVIVLDNSKGTLESSSAGQEAWLKGQLAEAQAQGLPVVAVAARPLRGRGAEESGDGQNVASLLARSGVIAVFTPSTTRLDQHYLVPESAEGGPQIPEYEGASLGYQKPENNGVKWYFVSVDTHAGTAHVNAVPVVDSLSLKPLNGLSVARSLTLRFEAVGRRPPGTLATTPGRTENGEVFPGYDNYVEIPSPGCKGPCVQPSYSFASSDPTIGDFVEPSGPGSPLPRLDGSGHPIPSSSSGLFCAYNSGSTTVSITTGLLSYSQQVTVAPGGFGAPCGTVYRAGVGAILFEHNAHSQGAIRGAAAPPPPSPAPLSGANPPLTAVGPRRRRWHRRLCPSWHRRPLTSRHRSHPLRPNRRRPRWWKTTRHPRRSCPRPRRPSSRYRPVPAATPKARRQPSARRRRTSMRASRRFRCGQPGRAAPTGSSRRSA
jgi:hypothetical protein